MAEEAFSYSIVVVGDMNPAIHTPEYYQLLGWISKSETSFALEKDSMIRSRRLAQFVTPRFSVLCTPDRWEIKARDKDLAKDVQEVANSVWEKLDATPVSAFGQNFNYHKSTSKKNVGELLHRAAMCGLGMNRPTEEPALAELWFASGSESRSVRVKVEQSARGAEGVYVAVNVHHVITEKGYFSLSELLRKSLADDERTAEEMLIEVCDAIERQAE